MKLVTLGNRGYTIQRGWQHLKQKLEFISSLLRDVLLSSQLPHQAEGRPCQAQCDTQLMLLLLCSGSKAIPCRACTQQGWEQGHYLLYHRDFCSFCCECSKLKSWPGTQPLCHVKTFSLVLGIFSTMISSPVLQKPHCPLVSQMLSCWHRKLHFKK